MIRLICLNCEKELVLPNWVPATHNNILRIFCSDRCMRKWLGLRPTPDTKGEEE